MSNYDNEQRAMDAAVHDEQKGEVLQVLGWALMFMAGISCVFVWVGWRAGTWFWFWWTFGLGGLGTVFAIAGAMLGARAAKDFAALSGTLRAGLAPRLGAEKLPAPEDAERRAA